MLMGLPAILTGGALVAYAIGKHFNPSIEMKILGMFTGKKQQVANIIKNFGSYIKAASEATGVPWQYIVAIIWNETKGLQPAINSGHPQPWVTIESGHKQYYPSGSDYHLYSSYGPMQVSWTTAGHDLGYVSNWQQLLDFKINILTGAKVLAYKYSRYGTWDNAVMAYNGALNITATKSYLKNASDTVLAINDMVKAGEVYYA